MANYLIASVSALLLLAACGNNSSGTSEDTVGSESSAADIVLKSEFNYQQEMGNSVEGKSTTPALFKKRLGTSIGAKIVIPEFFMWSLDSSEWEKGGKLYIANDDSMGSEFGISCAVSSEQGDKIMVNKARREFDISGTIASYSSSSGLLIDPCVINRDELDSPKKEVVKSDQAEPQPVLANLQLVITNMTAYPVKEIYVSPSDSDDWGQNRLSSNQILSNGDRIRVDIPEYKLQLVDVKLVDTDGDTYTFTKFDVSSGELTARGSNIDKRTQQ